MNMYARVTLRDLARATGLHFTTVGLALRGDRRVAAETAAQVRAAAERLGYRPDAMLSALSSYRHRAGTFRGTVGYLLPAPLRQILERNDGYRIAYQAAVAAAEAAGLKVQPIHALAPGFTPERLAQMLEARGIRALILAPLFQPGEYPALPWEKFSVVAIGYSVLRPAFHRVSPHQARSTRELIRVLRERGYVRIGFVLSQNANVRTGHNFLGAYLAEQELQPESSRLRPLVTAADAAAPAELARWLKRERPDALMATGPELLDQVEALGYRVPGALGLALTGIRPRQPQIAGMDERWDAIGQAAIDLTLSLMKNHEIGVPAFPRFVLVEGAWTEGKTVRAAADLENGQARSSSSPVSVGEAATKNQRTPKRLRRRIDALR